MTDAAARLTALAGRYVIKRELGQGGMATVYLAARSSNDRGGNRTHICGLKDASSGPRVTS